MKIMDSHVHFWNFEPVRDSWITDNMMVIQRDFHPQDIIPSLHENGVEGIIAIQADQSDNETAFLLQLAATNPLVRGVIGWVDLTAADLEKKLIAFKATPVLKGFRHIAEAEAEGFLVRKDILEGIALLGKYAYTYDILVRDHQIADALALSSALPGQRFMIDHCAKPTLKSGHSTLWARGMATLAQNPFVYCKLSGLITESNWHNCNEEVLYRCMDVIFTAFGTERVCFGSDWPVMLLAGNYTQWIEIVKKYIARFSVEQQHNILYGNALRFYNL